MRAPKVDERKLSKYYLVLELAKKCDVILVINQQFETVDLINGDNDDYYTTLPLDTAIEWLRGYSSALERIQEETQPALRNRPQPVEFDVEHEY